jgi:hypothetical protein
MNDAFDNARTDREALERYGAVLTHAVTVPQPMAWAIASGHCSTIPADTRPDMGREGELLGIHAGLKRYSTLDAIDCWHQMPPDSGSVPLDLPRGALIGVARLVGVVRRDEDLDGWVSMIGRSVTSALDAEDCARIAPWWPPGTKWGLLLSKAVLLSEPIPMRGSGGVWRLPPACLLGGLCVDERPHHCDPRREALEQ